LFAQYSRRQWVDFDYIFDVLFVGALGLRSGAVVVASCARAASYAALGQRNDVRCAAKIGHANCADHMPGIAREVPIAACDGI
jgi:hypothetical protein